MYIINDTYFQAPKREIPNLDEADSRAFAELELLIDEKCRLLLLDFLTVDQAQELDSYLVDGLFPEEAQPDPLLPDYVPQKWIDLVNGVEYTKNDVTLLWNGLIYSKGTYKGSLLADYVYYYWLETQASYMTGVGDAKGQPKGAILVNPTQRLVSTWNDFAKQYQGKPANYRSDRHIFGYFCEYSENREVSLIQFLQDNNEDYPSSNPSLFVFKNQLGL